MYVISPYVNMFIVTLPQFLRLMLVKMNFPHQDDRIHI